MEPITFPEHTVVIAKDQPQYRPLPAYRRHDDPEGRIIFCWKLTWRERVLIALGRPIWHHVLTFGQNLQPQLLAIEKPSMPSWLANADPTGK